MPNERRRAPFMKLVDLKHVSKQDVLLAEQGAGDEVSHGGVVHLCRVALKFNGNIRNRTKPTTCRGMDGKADPPPEHTEAPPRTLSPSPAARSSHDWKPDKDLTLTDPLIRQKILQSISVLIRGSREEHLPPKNCQVLLFF